MNKMIHNSWHGQQCGDPGEGGMGVEEDIERINGGGKNKIK